MRHLTASGEEITLASMTHRMHRSYLLASQVERPGRRRSADHSKKQRRRRRFSHSSTSCSMSCGYGGHSAITHGHAISTFPTMILTTWRQSNACLVALSMCLLVNCSKQGTDRGSSVSCLLACLRSSRRFDSITIVEARTAGFHRWCHLELE